MNLLPEQEKGRRDRMEIEANRFAALLLMPPHKFRIDANLRTEPNIKDILSIAEKYNTSKEATARTYVEYREEACAVVIGHKGSILRTYKGRNCPFIQPHWNAPFPQNSISQKSKVRNFKPSEIQEVTYDTWFDRSSTRNPPRVYEQFLQQRNEYSLTLLFIEYIDEIEEYEEDLIQQAWSQPRFHK